MTPFHNAKSTATHLRIALHNTAEEFIGGLTGGGEVTDHRNEYAFGRQNGYKA